MPNEMTPAEMGLLSQGMIKEIEDNRTTSEEMKKLCRKVAAQSCVLLENRDFFPIAEEEQVAVFGRCQVNTFYVGYGSGGDIRPPYRISIAEGLLSNGLKIDREIYDLYEQWCQENVPDEGYWGNWPRYYKEMPVSENIVSEAARRNKKAIMIIGRAAGEDRESTPEEGSWYLTKDEKAILESLKKHFSKVAVLLNCGSIMDTSFVKEYQLEGAMYIWQGGQETGNAVYDVISGKVNPSGHLTDTIASLEDYPSNDNFGNKDINCYTEDIYVGYRYFESFAKEKVIYPFGYGLSYTTFEWTVIQADDEQIIFSVKNTGNRSGRAVLQIYGKAPQGSLGKAELVLTQFVKTEELDPGKEEVFIRKWDWEMISSYDETGKTGYPHSWILEPGTYEFFLGFDVRNVDKVYSIEKKECEVVKACKEACAPETSFERMIRKDGKKEWEEVPLRKISQRERILENLPEELPYTGHVKLNFRDVKDGNATLEEFVSQLSVEELETIARGSLEGMDSQYGPVGNAGVFGGNCEQLIQRGIPSIATNDGPSGVRLQAHSTLMPNGVALVSTFDVDLIEELTYQLGLEMKERDSRVLLAPGMNIHRHPLCGRNFEYFSEDPYVTGKMGAAYVKGVQNAGMSATPKHFACNSQETNRVFEDSVLSERALREIYLKGFEICLKEAQPDCLMTAYNKINGEYCYDNYDLATQILRKEWGFDGLVMTDWWMQSSVCNYFKDVRDQAYRIRAFVNVFMPGSASLVDKSMKPDGSVVEAIESEEGITLGELQANAIQVLKFCLKYV